MTRVFHRRSSTPDVADRRLWHGNLALRVRSSSVNDERVLGAKAPGNATEGAPGNKTATGNDDLGATAIRSTGAPARPQATVDEPTNAARETADTGTVVLIHGLGTSHRSHRRLHDELARTNPVYSLDLPGFGGLPTPVEPLGVAALALAVAGVLDALGVSQATVVGHSMGAQWAVELARQRPDLAARIILIGPVTDPERCTARQQSLALGRDMLKESVRANTVVFGDYLRCRQSWYLTQLAHMLSYPMANRVADLRLPVLVLRGANDPIATTAWCRTIRDRAHAGSLVAIPNHRHVVQYTAARAVASAIRTFIVQTQASVAHGVA